VYDALAMHIGQSIEQLPNDLNDLFLLENAKLLFKREEGFLRVF
jgi:hypothetical protein